jgi:hypothetical protein
MADRQHFTPTVEPDPELKKVPEASRSNPVTEEELREQRMSFAFGLCQGQYDVTELAVGLPQSACSTALGVERQEQQPESNVEQNGSDVI